jgi:hypothetical protein
MKSTFIIYFRSLFKHFIIKARSIKLPNESKKKNELENICTEWLELNELFRKFVSFVTIDQIYTKNASVKKKVNRSVQNFLHLMIPQKTIIRVRQFQFSFRSYFLSETVVF